MSQIVREKYKVQVCNVCEKILLCPLEAQALPICFGNNCTYVYENFHGDILEDTIVKIIMKKHKYTHEPTKMETTSIINLAKEEAIYLSNGKIGIN